MTYVHKGYKWDRNEIVINNSFAFQVALDIIRNYVDLKLQNVEDYMETYSLVMDTITFHFLISLAVSE